MTSAINDLFSPRELVSLQKDAPTPLYFQMYTLLKNRVMDGSISHGTLMPTEFQLADAFGVSRITAKRAMDELAAEELVERRRGRGTTVIHHYQPETIQGPLTAMLEKLASMSRKTFVKVLDVGKQLPPADIQVELGLRKGEKGLCIKRVRYAEDGTPFAHYISWTRGMKKGYTRKALESRLRLDILRDNGIVISRIDQYLSAGTAQDFVATALGMKPGDPVLLLKRVSFDARQQVVDILYCHYHPKRFQYRMSLDMEDYVAKPEPLIS